MCKDKTPWATYIGYDLFGNEYNCKFPPNTNYFGHEFGGYSTPNQETFFYDFCVLLYGVAFSFAGSCYEAEFTNNGPILRNCTSGKIQGPFEDAVKLLEESNINGMCLKDVIDEVENVVIH